MELCRKERGAIPEAAAILAKSGKYRPALKAVRNLSADEKGSRILVFEGCLYALLERWNSAAESFSAALKKDAGDIQALDCLTEALSKRRFLSW